MRRSENVGDAKFQVSTFSSHLETKEQPISSRVLVGSRAGSAQSTRGNGKINSNADASPASANKGNNVAHDIKLEDIADDWDSPRNNNIRFV